MMPYQPDYDMYSSNQEAAERDAIEHDIWLCHQRIKAQRQIRGMELNGTYQHPNGKRFHVFPDEAFMPDDYEPNEEPSS